MGKNLPANVGDVGSMPGSVSPLEKGLATHSIIFAWRIPRTVRRGAQGASCVAPGKLGLDACGKGERVIALESW